MNNTNRMEQKTYMVVDVESIGFGIAEYGKTMAIKFNNETKCLDTKYYKTALDNPFVKVLDEEKAMYTEELAEIGVWIEFNSFGGKFEIVNGQDKVLEVEEYFKDKGWKLSKKNGYSIWKKKYDGDKEFKEKQKEFKVEVNEQIEKDGYTVKYEKLEYDIAYSISRYNRKTKQMDVLLERSFLVKEVFTNMKVMKLAYFFSKHSKYLELLSNGEITMLPYQEILNIMNEDIEEFNVNTLSAYNVGFDTTSISDTIKILNCKRPSNFKKLKNIVCIWNACCDMLYARPSFVRLAMAKGWISDSGKFFTTNAEIGYRYMTGDHDFIEEHTGMEDVRIETKLLGYCLRQGKKIEKGVINHPYRKLEIKKFFNIVKTNGIKTLEEVNALYKKVSDM